MTVESNYVITSATLVDWLKRQPMRSKTKTNRNRDFSRALSKSGILIVSSRCLLLLWLVGVIALVLVFRQSFENYSNLVCRFYVRNKWNKLNTVELLLWDTSIQRTPLFRGHKISVSGNLPTYLSPKLILTLTSHLGKNDGLGEG